MGELGELGATPVGFFTKLGEYLAEALRDRQADPGAYADERSVMQIYLSEGALSSHDEEGVIGLLTMTLMAAVFNTQVSLSWILAHLYEDPALLATARDELAGCDDLEVRVSRRPPASPCNPLLARRRPPSSLPLRPSPAQSYNALVALPFLNSCIDESVRLHTMLPGNTVLRRATQELAFDGVQV